MKVSEFPEGEEVFIDANLFIFHAWGDSEYGEASTQLLEMVERGEINAVTNVLVELEV